jgi:ubiquitin C-terminal hydrolase
VTRRKDVCINLAMPEKPTQRTLDWYLEQHFAADESQNGLQCDTAACKGNARDRKREFSIVGGPEILVIQLIRMRYNRHTDRMEKVMDRVGYPEKLDLSQWSEGSLAYQLNGIVSHSGTSLKGGHYIATVRSQSGDDFVHDRWPRGRILARAESATMQSYLLVYQKIGGRMAKCI